MPDHRNDEIPLSELLIFDDGERIFDGSDPDTFVVLEPGMDLTDLLANRDRRTRPGSPAYERAGRNPAAQFALDRLSKEPAVNINPRRRWPHRRRARQARHRRHPPPVHHERLPRPPATHAAPVRHRAAIRERVRRRARGRPATDRHAQTARGVRPS
jgi:hypothetical protein